MCAEPRSIMTSHVDDLLRDPDHLRFRKTAVRSSRFTSATGNTSDEERKLFSVYLCIYDVALKGTVQTKTKKQSIPCFLSLINSSDSVFLSSQRSYSLIGASCVSSQSNLD